jgi:hypothetical protein
MLGPQQSRIRPETDCHRVMAHLKQGELSRCYRMVMLPALLRRLFRASSQASGARRTKS